MDLELGQKRFLVTGASRGIGRAIDIGLLKEGAKVAIIARQEQGVQPTVSEFSQEFGSGQILGLVGDCTDSTILSKRIS